ncbi:DUF2867 domain-containing protein [Aeromonas rivuli]|uniref:DUF2867 domain-containing protein n=1 Tax=Aeromonas rivuli TaxID=648794 RepID=UPI000A065789|nr:DUF2867 domain-containing protein [Aeromonas rivuli]
MDVLKQSIIQGYMEGAYFCDTHTTEIDYKNQSALDIYHAVAKGTPAWIDWLMSLRNATVSFFGLKDLGGMTSVDAGKVSSEYKYGDVVGIFSILQNTQHEVILEDRDKHLDVKVSFLVTPNGDKATVHVTTVVHINNTLGKVYMFFVTPMHKIIVPHSLKSLSLA